MTDPLAIEAAPDPHREAVLTRAILPIALPWLAAIAVAVWVVNLSRAFLAGGKTGALVIVLIVTVSIMVGASLMSAAPRLRTSTNTMLVAALIAVIVTAGIISFGPSEEKKAAGAGGYVQPTGPATATVEIDALGSLSFQAKSFNVAAGVVDIKYVNKGGNHTLDFDTQDPNLSKFEIVVPPDGSLKADLKPGSYVVYCKIPGHRAAGMQATIKVT